MEPIYHLVAPVSTQFDTILQLFYLMIGLAL